MLDEQVVIFLKGSSELSFDFKSSKRYYPNGDFASYVVGYTVNKEDNNGKISKFSASLRKDYLNFTNLKSSKYYFDLDKWIFNNTSATK